MRKYYLIFLFFFGLTGVLQAQNDVFESEVIQRDGKIYYKNKPLTGTLYSDQDHIPNKCDCTLKASYKKGVLNGTKKEWYENGKLKFSGSYRMGKKDGIHTFYYDNGKKEQVLKYNRDVLLEKKMFYPNGNLQKKEQYKDGIVVSSVIYKRDGTVKSHSGTSAIEDKTSKKVKTGSEAVKTTPQKPFSKKNLSQVKVNKETFKLQNTNVERMSDGLHQSFYPNGVKERVLLVVNSLTIKDSIFYPNGKLQIAKKYDLGELIHVEQYNEKGKLIKEENFLNNKKQGLQQYYYDSGQPKKLENYENGQPVHIEVYNENGLMKREENYRFGKKHGLEKKFDDQGQLHTLKEYNMGQLIRHEKYTKEGKEIIRVTGNLAEIKVYKNNKLTKLKHENITTHQPDSLWLDFNPDTGKKIYEKAYVNGKLRRKGGYVNNQKHGEWIIYWQNGKKESRNVYQNGQLIKSETLTYARQIKNNYQPGDLLFRFKTYAPKEKDNYVLVRIDSVQNTSEKLIKNKIIETLTHHNLSPVTQIKDVENQELYAIINFSGFKIRLKSKNNKHKKFLTYIAIDFKEQNFEDEKNKEKKLILSPVTYRKPNINDHYVKDKKEAFYKSLNNLPEKLNPLMVFDVAGLIRAKDKSGQNVSTAYINLGENQGVKEKDEFEVKDRQGVVKARLRIIRVFPDTSIAKVIEGNRWLFNDLQTKKMEIATKK